MQRMFHFSSTRYWLIAGPPHIFVVIEVKCVLDDESNQIFSFLKKEKKYCDTSVKNVSTEKNAPFFCCSGLCQR